MAEVRRAVDGGAAHVHRHLAGLAGLEGDDPPLGGVEQVQHGGQGTATRHGETPTVQSGSRWGGSLGGP